VRHFRVELLDDRGLPLAYLLRLYQRLLSGSVTGPEVWKSLNATNRVGVTRGTLEDRRHPLAIG
jgi:putative protease